MDLSLDGEDEDLMILKEVLELTGFSREKIRRWRKLKLIPEPKCRLGPYRNSMLCMGAVDYNQVVERVPREISLGTSRERQHASGGE